MPNLRDPRIVKIFFSSPFGGMEEEREELTRRYFPIIQHLCTSHGLQFAAVDMRWGITAESSEKAEVINICLHELDRSDMFIGFFGQRYGWNGAGDSVLQKNFDNAKLNYPWLDEVRDKSVTELEFMHGFLNDPGYLPAALFFRDKAYDDSKREEGVQRGDKKQVFKYSAESELSSQLMDDLKRRVSDHKDKSLGVYMDYKTPAEAAKIMHEIIMDYLKNVLLVDLAKQQKSSREELQGQHDAFLASRANIFVHGKQNMDTLNKQIQSESGQHVVVTGDAGCGKSALLCNWIKSLQHIERKHDNLAVVYHFIGFADDSTDVNNLLDRVVKEFNSISTKLVGGKEEESKSTWEDGENRTEIQQTQYHVQKLLKVLNHLVSVGKTPVLVLDGLEKIVSTNIISRVLYWLPVNIPRSCLVVLATQDSDTTNIEELVSRNYLNLHLQPLPNDSKREMCVKTLEASGKELSPQQLDRIVEAKMTENPLFLKITMSELIAFGYFRLLDKKIDSLISFENIMSLFGQVLDRLEEDYNVEDYQGNLVEQVFCCINLSNQGMFETELVKIFAIPGHIWSPLYFAIEQLTVNQSGRIQFGFRELGAAVEKKYLTDVDKKQYYLRKLVAYFNIELQTLEKSNQLDGADIQKFRPASEMPELLLKLEDNTALIDCLSNFFVFSYLHYHNKYQLISLWRQAELGGEEICDRLMSSFDKRLAHIYVNMADEGLLQTYETPGLQLIQFIKRVDLFLEEIGQHEFRRPIIERGLRIMKEGISHGVVNNPDKAYESLHLFKYHLACVLCQYFHTAEEGIQLHLELIEHLQQLLEKEGRRNSLLIDLGKCYHGIGVGCSTRKQHEKMIEYSKKSISYEMQVEPTDMSQIALSWNNIGMAYMFLEQFEEALEFIDKSLKALEEYYFGEVPPVIGEILTNKALCLRRMDRLDEAEEEYHKSLAVKINALGEDHTFVAMAYMNLGTLYTCRSDYKMTLKYNGMAKDIYEKTGQTWNHPAYIMVFENLLYTYVKLEEYHVADEDYMRLLDWRVNDGTVDHGLPGVYWEMTKYYIREGMPEKAYKSCVAVLGSSLRTYENGMCYLLMDMACQNLPQEFREKHPEFSLANGVKEFPGNVGLVKHYCENYLIPSNNVDELMALVNGLHENDGAMGVDVYVHTSQWCENGEQEVNNACQRRIIQEGLDKYPDNLDLNLSMAKSYRRTDEAGLALPYAIKVADQQLDNKPLLMLTAHTAALAAQCDVCSKYCQIILEKFSDDEVTANQVKNLTDLNEETRKMLSQAENQPDAE